jgi:hypothetical protein
VGAGQNQVHAEANGEEEEQGDDVAGRDDKKCRGAACAHAPDKVRTAPRSRRQESEAGSGT